MLALFTGIGPFLAQQVSQALAFFTGTGPFFKGRTSGGAGCSGYVYTSSTAASYPTGCLLTSKYYLTGAQTLAGNSKFESPNGGEETGHSGDGAVIIMKLK